MRDHYRGVVSTERSDGAAAEPEARGRDRRAEQRRERRSQLLEAAVAEIRRSGPGVTMEQLARAGGVTKPILYRHFGDRDGLIEAIAEQFSAALLNSIVDPLRESTNARDLLDTTIDSYVRFLEREPFVYRFVIQQSDPRHERGSVASLVDVVARQIAVVMGEQLALANTDTGAALPWSYGIVGLVHQATDWWLRDQSMGRERFVRYLTDMLWSGLDGAALPVPAPLTS